MNVAAELDVHNARRRVRAHAAGVRAAVAVESPFVVLRRREEFHRFAVDERHHGSLFPAQAFFDDDLSPGVAKDAFLHDVGDRLLGLLDRRRDDDTLSCGKAVSFDDNGRAVFADELPGV